MEATVSYISDTNNSQTSQTIEAGDKTTGIDKTNESVVGSLSEARQDSKLMYSALMHDKVAGKPLDDIIEQFHLSLPKTTSLISLLNADYIDGDDKLRVKSAIASVPYLYDITHLEMEPDVYSHIALYTLLSEEKCCIAKVNGKLAILIGSVSGFDYIERNRNNRYCPINQYFKHRNVAAQIYSAMSLHIDDLLKAPGGNRTEHVYDLANQSDLYTFFEKAVAKRSYRFRCLINNDENTLESLSSFSGNIDSNDIHHVIALDNVSYSLKTMSDVSRMAEGKKQPYVHLRDGAKKGIAYRISSINLPNSKLMLDLELFPTIDDSYASAIPNLTEDNLTSFIQTVRTAIAERSPLIVHLATSTCPKQRYLRLVKSLLEHPMDTTAVLNQKQISYRGKYLFPMVLDESVINELSHIHNAFVLYGELRDRNDIQMAQQLCANLIPTIAFIKANPKSMPIELQQFVIDAK